MDTEVTAVIKKYSKGFAQEIVALRRRLHQNAELGFEEHRTAEIVAAKLKDLGLKVVEGVAKTGVVGLLDVGSSRTIALRADMDALPLEEETGLEFASINKGVMHACGHDANMAIVLGAAMILTKLKGMLKVNVKFIFQPCEESIPGGASEMIRQGVLKKPTVEAIFGIHMHPQKPVGKVLVGEGIQMASTDTFSLSIFGRSGHGGYPNNAIDSIVVAAEVILALQTIPSRRASPTEPVVLTIGTINGGKKTNIIADEVELSGTIRTTSAKLRDAVPGWIEQLASGIAAAHGADYRFELVTGRPLLENSPELVPIVKEAVAAMSSELALYPQVLAMCGEDFAYFLQKVPGVYFYFGCAKEEGVGYQCHHPRFDIDERVLGKGSSLLAQLVFCYAKLLL